MSLSLLLDSVILIDHLNGVNQATHFIGDRLRSCAISSVTLAEVLAGLGPSPAAVTTRFLDLFPCLPLGRGEAVLAARLRRARRWKLPDAMQAALAQTHGLKLATRNTADFDPERDDFVFVPYRL